MTPKSTPNLLMLAFAFTTLPLLLLVVSFIGKNSDPAREVLAPVVAYLVGGAALVAGVFLSATQLLRSLPRPQFQTKLVMCLACTELASLVGFISIGQSSLIGFVPFVAGTVLANVLFIVPRVVAYSRQA